MKSYPSISKIPECNEYFIFDKLDGSNLRFEWSKKRGWYKFGTRNHLFDKTDVTFGPAIDIFYSTLADALSQIAGNQKWQEVVVFCEFWGKNSFAGKHNVFDEKYLTIIDVAPYKKGILGPKEFIELFGALNIASYLGKAEWNKEFVDAVRDNTIPGITFEGVVGKSGASHKLSMVKAKTQQWIDKVLYQHGEDDGNRIINS